MKTMIFKEVYREFNQDRSICTSSSSSS